jgi:septal ring factor EnvC (AmiA/AmiB activator)
MSTMLVEIYDALKEAGASEEKARAAAASLTGRDDRLDRVERRLDQVEHRLDQVEHRLGRLEQKVDRIDAGVSQLGKELAGVQAQIGLLKWMNGIVIAGVAALILRAFFP